MEHRNLEQRYAIKFCAKLHVSATETLLRLNKAYGSNALSRSQVFRWHKAFSEGREPVEDDPRPGRAISVKTSANKERVKSLILTDRRLSIRFIAHQLNINRQAATAILTEQLGLRKLCGKMVPKTIMEYQKQHRKSICQDIANRVKSEPEFLQRVITGDEICFYEYDAESETVPTEEKNPKYLKTTWICFFDQRGVVHKEFVPQNQIVDNNYYVEVLERLQNSVRTNRPQIAKNWILHHDNTSHHCALSVMEYFTANKITVLPQPLFSPDLSPCDFFLYHMLNNRIKCHHFETIDDMQKGVTEALKDLTVKNFKTSFEEWQDRWKRCIRSDGDYFEEKKDNLVDL